MSFRTRLARTTLVDSERRDTVGVIWSFFTEDADDVARRNGGEIFEQPGIRFGDVDSAAMLRVGVYQYMVANTDWALQLYHNIRILKIPPGIYYPVPYDFDFSGIIKTPYAHPSPKLPIRSVRERLYRGPCPDMAQLAPIFAEFNAEEGHDLRPAPDAPRLRSEAERRRAQVSRRVLQDHQRSEESEE